MPPRPGTDAARAPTPRAEPKRSRTRGDAPADDTRATRRGERGAVLRFVRRRGLPVALGLAALHALLALLAMEPAPHPGADNAVYLSLGRSLLEGGYRDLFDPATPDHAQFPPGWPAIVAAALAVGIKPWIGLKIVVVAFSALAVALTYLWIRRRRQPVLALVVAALVAVSPGVLDLAHWELSDVPFWTFLTAALLGWERLGRARTGRTALASLATAAAYATRSAALPLLVAAAGWLALKRRWRQLAVFAAVTLPPFAAWWLWTRAHGGYARLIAYVDPYAPDKGTVGAWDMVVRAGDNLRLYGGRYLPTLVSGSAGTLAVALSVALVAFALYGWMRRVRRPGVTELVLPLYVGMLLVWSPAFAGERLLLPIYPMLLLYAGEAAIRLGRLARPLPRVALPAAAGAAVLLVALPGAAEAVETGRRCTAEYRAGSRYACLPPGLQDFYAMAELAPRIVPDGSVVLSRKAALFWAASGVPGRTYPLERSPDALFRAAREAGARYVMLDRIDEMAEQYLTPILMRRPQAFCVMYAQGPEQAALLAIRPGAEAMADLRDDPGAAQAEVGFQLCGPELWRSPEARRELLPQAP